MTPFRELLRQETELVSKIEGWLKVFESDLSKIPTKNDQAEFDRLMAELPKLNKKMINHMHFIPYTTTVPH